MPSLDELAAALAECPALPEPKPMNRDGYDLAIMVPEPTLTTFEQRWLPGDAIVQQVRPGTINAAGGGKCGLVRWQTARGDFRSEWSEFQSTHSNCVAVPEPGHWIGLAICALILVGLRLRRP